MTPFPVWVTVIRPGTTAAGATRAAKARPHQGVAAVGAVVAAALVVAGVVVAVKHGAVYLTAKLDGGQSDV